MTDIIDKGMPVKLQMAFSDNKAGFRAFLALTNSEQDEIMEKSRTATYLEAVNTVKGLEKEAFCHRIT